MSTFTGPKSDLQYKHQTAVRHRAGCFAQLFQYCRCALLTRQMVSELSHLDDHLLRDIGIQDRFDIPRLVRRRICRKE